jgi:alpha-tubulin suppressor-like RCC1 family protein
MMCVLDSGDVATWGRGQAGALGHGDERTTTVPRLISSLHGIRITRAAAGWSHSAFLTGSSQSSKMFKFRKWNWKFEPLLRQC